MMTTNSLFGLDDMEALVWGSSSPMADMGSLIFHPDKEEEHEGGKTSLEGDTSPVSSLTSSSLSSSSSPPFYSPPPSPSAAILHGNKSGTESDLLSLSWLDHPGQLSCDQTGSDDNKEEEFDDGAWMTEKRDLCEFDLGSWVDPCSLVYESPSSPEDLLTSLDCPMELESFQIPICSTPVPPKFDPAVPATPPPAPPSVCTDVCFVPDVEPSSCLDGQEVPASPPCVPEPKDELEIKSEPISPDPPSPPVDCPSSPPFTLDLGSEVDVSDSEANVSENDVSVSESEIKPVVDSVVPQVPKLVLSLSSTGIVLLLASKNEVGVATTTVATTSEIAHTSPPPRSSRCRPYPEHKSKAVPASPDAASVKVKPQWHGGERAAPRAPKDRKLKKMEQNKTAATRYRQKKRAEQEALLAEHTLLERKNMELTEKAESMAREIEYLKELMEEVCQARIQKGLAGEP
ncbi:activating transcription factor 4b [Thalassophryne amazonica]|uniref:activating transcription factor 4b n=1 Tax=Thalassophryne amazonica TaxID=390379 RepID=UPI001470E97E|nr:activating transcription factor 4b [Thalassophryne amazonica]